MNSLLLSRSLSVFLSRSRVCRQTGCEVVRRWMEFSRRMLWNLSRWILGGASTYLYFFIYTYQFTHMHTKTHMHTHGCKLGLPLHIRQVEPEACPGRSEALGRHAGHQGLRCHWGSEDCRGLFGCFAKISGMDSHVHVVSSDFKVCAVERGSRAPSFYLDTLMDTNLLFLLLLLPGTKPPNRIEGMGKPRFTHSLRVTPLNLVEAPVVPRLSISSLAGCGHIGPNSQGLQPSLRCGMEKASC